VGAITLVSRLTMGLIYLKFTEVSGQNPLGPGSRGRRLAANIDITGLLMPAVLAGAVFNLLPLGSVKEQLPDTMSLRAFFAKQSPRLSRPLYRTLLRQVTKWDADKRR